MNIEKLTIKRKTLRTAFTECSNKIKTELSKDIIDVEGLTVLESQLIVKYEELEKFQEKISNAILSSDKHSEKDYENDAKEAEGYRDCYCELVSKIKIKRNETKNGESFLAKDSVEKRQSKLPKVELKKFSGEAKEFSSFWSQFEKIHLDENLSNEDKFQYLLQSLVPKSKAAKFVESFPATAANYEKAITQLKERFGRDNLLVQMYVRDLLGLVMKNAIAGRKNTDLVALFNELEAKIEALKNLGRTQEKYGDILLPLVESCFPEALLLTWERNRTLKKPHPEDRSLENLMNFLQKSARVEEMVELVRSELENNINVKKNEEMNGRTDPRTAAKQTNTSNTNIPDKEATQKPKCGLCGSRKKKLTKTPCCKNWICDDEDEYVMFSYARNSCHRNHRRLTLCSHHFESHHKGSWQNCKKCKDEFETPDYVTMGTCEYNFEKLENPEKFTITCVNCGFTSGTLDSFPAQTAIGYYCNRKKCQKATGSLFSIVNPARL